MNHFDIYVHFHKNDIIQEKDIKGYTIRFDEFINYLKDEILHSFNNITNLPISINQIKNLLQDDKINNYLNQEKPNSKNYINAKNKISYLKTCFEYLENILNKSFNDITELNQNDEKDLNQKDEKDLNQKDEKDLNQNDETELNQNDETELNQKDEKDLNQNDEKDLNQNLDDIQKNLDGITTKINQVINFVNILKISHFKIFKLFYGFTQILDTYHSKDPKPMIISSFLIDHNQEPILKINQNEKNELTMNESLKVILMNSIKEYRKITDFIKNIKDIDNLNIYFQTEVENFYSSISEKIEDFLDKKQQINELKTWFDDKISSFNILNLETMYNDQIIFNDDTNPQPNEATNSSDNSKQNDKNTDNYFSLLLNISKYHIHLNSEDIMTILNEIFESYESYVDHGQIIQLLKDIMKLNINLIGNDNIINSNETILDEINSNETILDQIKKLIESFLKEQKYYYFEIIFKKIMRNYVNQDVFNIYHKLLISDNNYDEDFTDSYFTAFDLICFSTYVAYSQLAIDNNFNICIEKIFCQKTTSEIIKKEYEIFDKNESKFIVHTLKNSRENKMFIPYFPLKTLNQCLFSQKNKLNMSLVDRIVIIKEIAIAMNDLNSMNHYHGNLSLSSFFISGNKDAYLGEIAYDRNREKDLTKTPEKVIYRAPEIFSSHDEKNESFLCDIYSFGIIMYEIITGKSIQILLRKKARYQIYQILTTGISDFMFNDGNDEAFNCNACDIRGDSFIGIKEIIQKCLKFEPSERYQSFDEIIKSIENMAFYENNKEEINYRIENAKNAKTYNCQLTDIIEAYYNSGDKTILKFIEQLFGNVNLYLYCIRDKKFSFDGDVIKSIFEYYNVKIVDDP